MTNKNYLSIFLSLTLSACSSLTPSQEVSREPSGKSSLPSNLRFDLYGSNPIPNAAYKFKLLDLSALKNQQVVFSNHELTDSSDRLISDWISQFQSWSSEMKKRSSSKLGFTFNKVDIELSKSDLDTFETAFNSISPEEPRDLAIRKKIELISSFNENFKDPIETKFAVETAVPQLIGYMSDQSIPQASQKQNLSVHNSSFWQDRSQEPFNAFRGHGSFDVSTLAQDVCSYEGPKKGFGVHVGFKVKCNGTKLKVKFGGEIHSGPLNSRLYHRLGYNVPAISFVPALKVKFNPKLFSEINDRKANVYRVTLVGKPVATIKRPKVYDGLDLIASVTTPQGKVIEGLENLKSLIYRNCEQRPCPTTEDNIRATTNDIATVTFKPSAVVEQIGEEVGPWHHSDLDHGYRPEIKGMMFLGAWTGNLDMRKDNYKLIVDPSGAIKHFISDPGAGLGNQSNVLSQGQAIQDMQWDMTYTSQTVNGDETQKSVEIKFKPFAVHDAFSRVSFGEAQWIVRKIAQVSEEEISHMLAASGLKAAQFLLLREKMISIQQQFVKDFNLTKEFPALMARKVNKKLNYDHTQQARLVPDVQGKKLPYEIESGNVSLKNGTLVYQGETGFED